MVMDPQYVEPAPPFVPCQSVLYTEYGGVLWEEVLMLSILDSLGSLRKSPPRLRPDTTNKQRVYVMRKQWNHEHEIQIVKDARLWVLGKMPDALGMYEHGRPTGGIWQFLFDTDPSPVVEWLRDAWKDVDKNPGRTRYYRDLFKRRYRGGRK